VNRVDLRIFDQLIEIRIPPLDPEGVANGIELLFCPLTDGKHLRVRMPLINRNELRAKAKTDDGDVDFLSSHGVKTRADTLRGDEARAMTASVFPAVNTISGGGRTVGKSTDSTDFHRV
jgi:hypothetical protein